MFLRMRTFKEFVSESSKYTCPGQQYWTAGRKVACAKMDEIKNRKIDPMDHIARKEQIKDFEEIKNKIIASDKEYAGFKPPELRLPTKPILPVSKRKSTPNIVEEETPFWKKGGGNDKISARIASLGRKRGRSPQDQVSTMAHIKRLKDKQKKIQAERSDSKPQRKEVETQKNTGYASKHRDTRGSSGSLDGIASDKENSGMRVSGRFNNTNRTQRNTGQGRSGRYGTNY